MLVEALAYVSRSLQTSSSSQSSRLELQQTDENRMPAGNTHSLPIFKFPQSQGCLESSQPRLLQQVLPQ